VPCTSTNLACRAALSLKEASGVKVGVHIELRKGIPVAAGLGGGSADAAAVLRGLNLLWDTGFSICELQEIGQNIGADVPFCIAGGTALAEGYGEILSPLQPVPKMWMVLYKPGFGVSTAEVYNAHDRMDIKSRHDTQVVLLAIEKNDINAIIAGIGNALQQTTTVLYPQVEGIISALLERETVKVFMCGSGPTVCAVFTDKSAAENFRDKCFDFNGQAYLAHTVSRGSFMLESEKRGEKVGRKKAYTYTIGKL
jgi:4-diphosphocytidyl-2-C-methyl-D-erythritol kinase